MSIGALSGGFSSLNPLLSYVYKPRSGGEANGNSQVQQNSLLEAAKTNTTQTTAIASPADLLNVLASKSTVPASSLKPAATNEPAVISSADLGSHSEKLKGLFKQEFGQLLRENGINTREPTELQADEFGNLTVTNDHPDAERINELLKGEDGLKGLFSAISANASLMEAIKEHEAFSKAYAIDPKRAVEEFSHLFEDDDSQQNNSKFTLRLTDDNIEVLFDGVETEL